MKIKKGMALITVIVIIMVLSILGFSLLGVSLAEAKQAALQEKKTQAHYVGRSGVCIGLGIIDEVFREEDITNIDALITSLNAKPKSFNVTTVGSCALSYEKYSQNELKIKSVGKIGGANTISDTVTYITKIKLAPLSFTNPDEWIAGASHVLMHGVTGIVKYIGSMVELKGNTINNHIAAPQGGGVGSCFQASIIYFQDSNNGISFKHQQNSTDIKFDAEIIYFKGIVDINTNNRNRDRLQLCISDSVIDYRTLHEGAIPKCEISAGFENYNRYKAFIGTQTVDNWHSEYEEKFEPGYHYGLVYFGGAVDRDGRTIIDSGYYFYKDGIDLQEYNGATAGKDLIKIISNDAIIKALDELFKDSSRSKEGYMWDNK